MDIERWVIVYIAVMDGRDADGVTLEKPLAAFDMDSFDAVEMAFEFERAFGRAVDPELFLRGDQTVGSLIAALDRGFSTL